MMATDFMPQLSVTTRIFRGRNVTCRRNAVHDAFSYSAGNFRATQFNLVFFSSAGAFAGDDVAKIGARKMPSLKPRGFGLRKTLMPSGAKTKSTSNGPALLHRNLCRRPISRSSSRPMSKPSFRSAVTMRRPFSGERAGKTSTSCVVPG